MLSLVLVLLGATSALAFPSYVTVSQRNINEIAPAQDTGSVNGGLIENVFDLVDGASLPIYAHALFQNIIDLSNVGDSHSQAIAVAQALAILGEIAHGNAGNACAAASAINSHAAGGSASSYLSTIAAGIDTVSQLASNPTALRFSTGPTGNCAGNGRSYNFESAWDRILDSASPYTIGLYNEQYCALKRLYTSHSALSNNIAAAATAAAANAGSLYGATDSLANFLRAAANGGNVAQAAASARAAIGY